MMTDTYMVRDALCHGKPGDLLRRAQEYLKHNAAESGADILIKELIEVIEECGLQLVDYEAREVIAQGRERAINQELSEARINLRHWREECGKLHARLAETNRR